MEQTLRHLRERLKTLDIPLLIACLFASLYGITLIFSATSSTASDVSRSVIVQFGALAIGLVAAIILSNIDFATLSDLWMIFYGISAAAIIFTIFFGTGPTGESNRNWIDLGFLSIQPSEFVKIAYILIFARAISKCKDDINSIQSLTYLGAVGGSLLLLMALQGDMGNLLVFLFITVVMLLTAGLSRNFFIAGGVITLIAAPFIWTNVLSTYMRQRILFGFQPELDPLNTGYQAIQSKIAIGSGQLTGKGFLNGTHMKVIPASETDFIFATAGEEFGLVGCILVIAIQLFIMFRVLHAAKHASDNVGTMVCTGFFALLFAQVFENIGMCIAILPVVGITLPFFSYGGSSMLSVWCGVGLVLSIRAQERRTLSFDV